MEIHSIKTKPQITNIFQKIFLVSFIFITCSFILILGEIIFRIKYLGFIKTIQSLTLQKINNSALGTYDWVISDSDLNYRLNPIRPNINEFSMKDKEIQIPKPRGIYRIIVLGDSIPFIGDPNFVDLLKNKIKTDKIEIFNASTPGYTTYQELMFLEKYAIKAEPDLVILSYCLNDNYKFLHRFNEKTQMLLTKEAQDSLKINNSFDAFVQKSYLLTAFKTIFIKKNTDRKEPIFPWEKAVDFNIAWKDYSWPNFSNRLKKMNDILKNNHAKLSVVIFPIEMQLNPILLQIDSFKVTKPQRQVAFYSNKFNIPHLDLFSSFYEAQQKGTKLYTDGVHLSLEGENLAANLIYDYLIKDLP